MSIRLEYSATAKCRPEHIWTKFQEIEQWAWWNPVVARARWLQGEPWQKGSRFAVELYRPKNFKFAAEVIESAVPNRIAWLGKGSGVRGEHWFSFDLQADGKTTLMKTWENFSGLGTIFFGSGIKRDIVKMYEDWLAALKFEAERIAREEYARSQRYSAAFFAPLTASFAQEICYTRSRPVWGSQQLFISSWRKSWDCMPATTRRTPIPSTALCT